MAARQPYDLFVSYAAADAERVKGCLLPALNLPPACLLIG